MAVKTKVRVDLRIRKLLEQDILTDQDKRDIGREVVEQSKELISKGISPVKGAGRFEGYKAQGEGDKRGYPYNMKREYPGKRVRPVNLFLSGEMLSWFKSWSGKGKPNSVEVGISPDAPDDVATRARAHNDGLGNVPERRWLPTQPGEQFAETILQAVRGVYIRRLTAILKK